MLTEYAAFSIVFGVGVFFILHCFCIFSVFAVNGSVQLFTGICDCLRFSDGTCSCLYAFRETLTCR